MYDGISILRIPQPRDKLFDPNELEPHTRNGKAKDIVEYFLGFFFHKTDLLKGAV